MTASGNLFLEALILATLERLGGIRSVDLMMILEEETEQSSRSIERSSYHK